LTVAADESVIADSPANSPERPRGRRRLGTDARGAIVAAAGHEFSSHGYDGASFRAIARRAGVDPALVHHYFSDKADLFAEAIRAPIRPDRIVAEILRGPRDQVGENLVRMLLGAAEDPKVRDRVIGLIRTALGHDFAATMLRQFLFREVFHRIAEGLGVPDGELRANLAGSQMVGLMVVRYGIQAEPLASEAADEVVRRVGPVIQWHLVGFPGALGVDSGQQRGE
jgi:AcrR family transcriptional regulator